MICSGMICHQVGNYLESLVMCLFNQPFEIRHGAKFRVNGTIIRNSVITSQRPLSIYFTDGGHWHEPEYFDTHFLQSRKMGGESAKRSFFRVLPNVHFINGRLVQP